MLRHLIVTLLAVLSLSFAITQVKPSETSIPYVYYYSNIDHAIVIEHADGTDSRLLGQGLMPPNQNVIGYFDWSPSGEWVAWASTVPSEGANITKNIWIMRTDGSHRVTVLDNLGGYFQMLKWSPKQDYLLVIFTKGSTLSYLIVDPEADKIIAKTSYEGRPVQYLESYNGSWLDRGNMVYFFITVGDTQLLGTLSVENQTTTHLFQSFTGSILGITQGRIFRRNFNFETNQTDLIVEDLNSNQTMTLVKNVSDKSSFALYWAPKFDRAILTENLCPQNTNCQTGYPNRLSLVNWTENKVTFIGNDLYLQNTPNGWSPDSNLILLRNADKQTVLLNVTTVEIHPVLGLATPYSWQWIGTDNTALYAVGDYQSAAYFLYNSQTGLTQPFSLPSISTTSFAPINNIPITMIASPDGRYLGMRENTLMTYKIYDRQEDKTLPWITHSYAERGGLFTDYLWHPDNYWYMTGQRISFAGGGGGPEAVTTLNVDGTIRRELGVCFSFPVCAGFVPERVLPHLAKGSPKSVVQQPLATLAFPQPVAFAWSPDSTTLATYNFHDANDRNPSLKLWDMTHNPPQLIKEIAAEDVWSGQSDYVGRYAIWNTDGLTVSVFSQTTFKTWNIESGSLIDSGKISVELSPNRQYRWSKTNDTITIIDAKTNRELNHFQFNGDVNSLRWSLDGAVLFAQVEDDNLVFWNSQRNTINQFPIFAHYGVGYLSVNDQFLIMGNPFDIAHIWDIASGKQLSDLNFYPTAARFSPDGKRLAASTYTQLTIWDAEELGE